MLGRAAYHEPYMLAAVDRELFGAVQPPPTRAQVVTAMSVYLQRQVDAGVSPRAILRHMLGLFHGEHGARRWRRLLSEPTFVDQHGAHSLQAAARAFTLRRADWMDAAVSAA
jgi:tRNA-dihydrouridine synthase A